MIVYIVVVVVFSDQPQEKNNIGFKWSVSKDN